MRKIREKFVGFAKPVDDLQWMRMATLIDGEGCIHVFCNRAEYCVRRKTPQYGVNLTVVNTNPRIVEWCQEVFGGNVYLRAKKAKAIHKPSFTWAACARRAEAVLSGCLPFFLIKRQQAEAALALLKLISVYRKGPKPMAQADVDQRAVLYQEAKELNRRGIVSTIQ